MKSPVSGSDSSTDLESSPDSDVEPVISTTPPEKKGKNLPLKGKTHKSPEDNGKMSKKKKAEVKEKKSKTSEVQNKNLAKKMSVLSKDEDEFDSTEIVRKAKPSPKKTVSFYVENKSSGNKDHIQTTSPQKSLLFGSTQQPSVKSPSKIVKAKSNLGAKRKNKNISDSDESKQSGASETSDSLSDDSDTENVRKGKDNKKQTVEVDSGSESETTDMSTDSDSEEEVTATNTSVAPSPSKVAARASVSTHDMSDSAGDSEVEESSGVNLTRTTSKKTKELRYRHNSVGLILSQR